MFALLTFIYLEVQSMVMKVALRGPKLPIIHLKEQSTMIKVPLTPRLQRARTSHRGISRCAWGFGIVTPDRMDFAGT